MKLEITNEKEYESGPRIKPHNDGRQMEMISLGGAIGVGLYGFQFDHQMDRTFSFTVIHVCGGHPTS